MKSYFCFLRLFFLAALFFSFQQLAFARDYIKKIYLWENVPKMETQARDTVLYVGKEPSLYKSSSDKNPASLSENKTPAVIICPGGSYHHLGMKYEGFASMRWFTSVGIRAFVLRYRVAYNCHHYPGQLEDLQMALVYLREHADELNIDKSKIGAIGYSAGGHLVTMAGEFASSHNELAKLCVKTSESLRPDFIMPIYPVVSMQDDIAHRWSRRSLLGHKWRKPDAEKGWNLFTNFWGHAYSQDLKNEFSMENVNNIPDDMPPVFILACEDDPVVIYENSVRLDKALSEKNIPHLFVSYPEGGHGFGMKKDSRIMKKTRWNDADLLPWLKANGVLN